MTIQLWTCNQCKQKYRDFGSYKTDLGLDFSLTPEKDICVKCYNEEGKK